MRDLKSAIPGAEYFTYGEFVKSDTAIRLGIKNIPNEIQWSNIEKLAINVLMPIRKEFGKIRITSGFRCVELCNAIGSNSSSNHTRGEAADIEPYDSSIHLINIADFIVNRLEYRELIAEYFPEGWCHVAYREGANIKKIKLKDSTHNYTVMKWSDLTKLYPIT